MIFPPMAAWIATWNISCGITSWSLSAKARAPELRLAAVHDTGKRVDGFAIDEDVELHQVALAIAVRFRNPSSRNHA